VTSEQFVVKKKGKKAGEKKQKVRKEELSHTPYPKYSRHRGKQSEKEGGR